MENILIHRNTNSNLLLASNTTGNVLFWLLSVIVWAEPYKLALCLHSSPPIFLTTPPVPPHLQFHFTATYLEIGRKICAKLCNAEVSADSPQHLKRSMIESQLLKLIWRLQKARREVNRIPGPSHPVPLSSKHSLSPDEKENHAGGSGIDVIFICLKETQGQCLFKRQLCLRIKCKRRDVFLFVWISKI